MDNVSKLNDLIGVDKYVKSMDKWINNLENKFLFLLLSGNTGVGKTSLGELFLKENNYEVMYFDMSYIKNKAKIYEKIKESFRSFDICCLMRNEKKKVGYIIDNIDNTSISKNDITELHNLFIKNNSNRPVIFIGKFQKKPNYPKKKIEDLKINNVSETVLSKIGKKLNPKIDNIKLNIIISKSQNDIKKFKILMEYLNKYDSDDIENINLKDCDYNLFSDFNNLISVYKPIKKTELYCDHLILLNYTFHQNIYNILLNNYDDDNIRQYLYDFNNRIYNNIEYEYIISKNNCWDLINYIYFNGPKYISYNLNKNKKNKNITVNTEYPKYCYILNQKNLLKKMILIFKDYDFYDQLNINNFKLFIESLFNNEEKNKDILSRLKKSDIEQLKKLLK